VENPSADQVHARRVRVIEALMPTMETVTVKKGGASYQVPTPISYQRRISLAVRWLVESAKHRLKKDRAHGIAEALALEVLMVIADLRHREMQKSRGGPLTIQSYALPKRTAVHKAAKVNRVFSHRRWR